MVKSEKIFSPQEYVEIMTGQMVRFSKDNIIGIIEEIESVLKLNMDEDLWDYALSEIDHIVENQIDVVLVDVSGFNEKGEFVKEFRWFEVFDDFNENR